MPEPRRLVPEDAEAYVALRREMLLEAPWAFLSSPNDDFAAAVEDVASKLAEPENAILAIDGDAGALLAAAGVYRASRPKIIHRANIWGVYTKPAARGQGLGRAVVGAAIETARSWSGVDAVALSCSARAEEARRVYVELGFKQWGVEPDALRIDGRSYDEVHMLLRLAPATDQSI